MRTIELFGRVGDEEKGVTDKSILAQLSDTSPVEDIHVVVNSPGGHVWQGLNIYQALVAREGMVDVEVRGIAGSIASVVAMAGDRITMHQSSRFMIHNAMGPSALAFGNAAKLREAADETIKTAELLDSISDDLVNIYAARTQQPREEIRAMMDAETFLTASEARSKGFVDNIIQSKQLAACMDARGYTEPLKTEAELVAVAEACSGLKVRNRRNTSIELLHRRKRQQQQCEAVLN